MENYYDDELPQFVNRLVNALEAYILQKGTLYDVEHLPYPTGTILHQGWEECKRKVADDRGLWDLLKGYVASIVENVTTWMTNAAEFVKRLVSRGRKLVEDIVNKMSVLISSIKLWFSKLIQRAKKMGMKVLVSLKTMATSEYSVGATFVTQCLFFLVLLLISGFPSF